MPGSCALGAPLRLAHDLDSPYFLEGDTVAFTVHCTGDLPTDDAVIEAGGLPDGASFERRSLSFEWATGPADGGGRLDVGFSVEDAADPTSFPAYETVTMWVADVPSAVDNVPVDGIVLDRVLRGPEIS